MRYVPLTREPLDPVGGTFGCRELITYFAGNDQRFNTNVVGIRAGLRIMNALEVAKEFVALESRDWETLKQCCETPQPMPNCMPYPINNTRKLLPYLDDIINATEDKPGEKDA